MERRGPEADQEQSEHAGVQRTSDQTLGMLLGQSGFRFSADVLVTFHFQRTLQFRVNDTFVLRKASVLITTGTPISPQNYKS